jgi:2-polyprenyl-3-methyl-5-hydroxy-6-metoxy-1,4-benzoquinol methylase
VSACCSSFACAASTQFGPARAVADLARYRKKGLDLTTRLLREELRDAVPATRSLLDIGAGVGALAYELLADMEGSAVMVEASNAYLHTARQEAERRGLSGRVSFVEGDFVALASGLAPADLVTMDRVVCCYPSARPLLTEGLVHARRDFALSYPQERWYMRAVTALQNAHRRLRHNPFRTYVHSVAVMHSIAVEQGFALHRRRSTLAWVIEVWRRVA